MFTDDSLHKVEFWKISNNITKCRLYMYFQYKILSYFSCFSGKGRRAG